jgi:hypothetical protein
MRRRTGLILLAVLALVTGNTTVAEAHPATPGVGIPASTGTIHGCFFGSLPLPLPLPLALFQRRLRVIQDTDTCLLTLTLLGIPILTLPIDNSLDWPATGVLTDLVESAPAALSLTLPAGAGQTGSANLNCPPGMVAIGLGAFTTTAPTAPATLIGSSLGGVPSNTLTVTFANVFPAPATISDLKAICVTQFTQ